MSTVVVIRNNNKETIITGRMTWKKFERIKIACGIKKKPSVWTPKAIQFVIDNYNTMSTRDIAKKLTQQTKKQFTRNMIIAKYRDLKKGK